MKSIFTNAMITCEIPKHNANTASKLYVINIIPGGYGRTAASPTRHKEAFWQYAKSNAVPAFGPGYAPAGPVVLDAAPGSKMGLQDGAWAGAGERSAAQRASRPDQV